MGCDGVEPPEPEGKRFTVVPATTYRITSLTVLKILGKGKMVPWTTPFTIGITIDDLNSDYTPLPITRLTYKLSPINLF